MGRNAITATVIDLIEIFAQGTQSEDSDNDSISLLGDLMVEEMLEVLD